MENSQCEAQGNKDFFYWTQCKENVSTLKYLTYMLLELQKEKREKIEQM